MGTYVKEIKLKEKGYIVKQEKLAIQFQFQKVVVTTQQIIIRNNAECVIKKESKHNK